jgi:hypothetical protein
MKKLLFFVLGLMGAALAFLVSKYAAEYFDYRIEIKGVSHEYKN